MIALYPLLVSNTVSRNIIPGIVKVLENYLIVYRIDDIIRNARIEAGITIKKQGKKLIQIESEDPLVDSLFAQFIQENEEALLDQSQIPGAFGGRTKDKEDYDEDKKAYSPKWSDEERKDIELRLKIKRAKEEKKKGKKEKAKASNKDASVNLQTYNMQLISLEPTWMKTDMFDKTGNKYSRIIGVKVVPYAVKSDAKLSNLLMYDKQVGKILRLVILMGRSMQGFISKTMSRVWKIVTFGLLGKEEKPVTGDPRKDILLKKNIISKGHEQLVFALANQAELSDTFTHSAKEMFKLEKMGWGSLIVADDVNRRASFCMTELKGLCSILPYSMLYQTMSQAKVFEDLEEAKRTASSIFKTRRKSFRKIIGESMAQDKIIEFGRQNLPLVEGELLNEIYLIDENFGSFIKKFKPANAKKIISGIMKGTVNVPNVSQEKLIKTGMKIDPAFKQSYNLARKVLKNSASEVNDNIINWTAMGIAFASVMQKSKDKLIATKDLLKKFMRLFIKVRDTSKTKIKVPSEHYVELAFGWTAIGIMMAFAVSILKLDFEPILAALKLFTVDVLFNPAIWVGAFKVIGGIAMKGIEIGHEIPFTVYGAIFLLIMWKITVSSKR